LTFKFAGALAALSIGYVSIDWTIYGEAIVAVLSFFEALMLYFAATANALWVVYVAYIFFTITYRLLITIARFLAKLKKFFGKHSR